MKTWYIHSFKRWVERLKLLRVFYPNSWEAFFSLNCLQVCFFMGLCKLDNKFIDTQVDRCISSFLKLYVCDLNIYIYKFYFSGIHHWKIRLVIEFTGLVNRMTSQFISKSRKFHLKFHKHYLLYYIFFHAILFILVNCLNWNFKTERFPKVYIYISNLLKN